MAYFTQKILLILFIFNSILLAQDNFSWVPYGRITEKAINECSGIVKSRQFENVFWTHNDSGDTPRIFAITAKGELIQQVWIPAAKNVDWEDIAVDDSGHIIIGDIGNNQNKRKDLTIYVVEEPNPYETNFAKVVKRIPFQFPDQKQFPNPFNLNFDCEATFWANGNLYVLTKHRSDRKTTLYRFGPLVNHKRQTLTKISEFNIGGMVTAADVSLDGKKLLLLCYEYIYLFEKPKDSDNYLAGKFKRILLEGRQSEGITFDNTYILFTNEQKEIYRLPESYLDIYFSFLPPLPKLSISKITKFKLDGENKEWTESKNNMLYLNRNYVSNSNQNHCDSPIAQIGWVEDGFLILIQNLVWPQPIKKPQNLIRTMFGLKYERTVHLEKGAFIWNFMRSGKKFYFERSYPIAYNQIQIPTFKIIENDNKNTIEIFIPAQYMEMESGNRCLFNLIINPNTSCEWYWASDSSMFSHVNPYIWGELILQD
ncbi:MAG: hypothetical protein ACE5JB_04590 [bacterium]